MLTARLSSDIGTEKRLPVSSKTGDGALSEQKVKGCLAERWCDPVPLLKGIDGFIIATRMLAQQLDVLVSNHACTVRIEKQPTAEHLMVLEVTKVPSGC